MNTVRANDWTDDYQLDISHHSSMRLLLFRDKNTALWARSAGFARGLNRALLVLENETPEVGYNELLLDLIETTAETIDEGEYLFNAPTEKLQDEMTEGMCQAIVRLWHVLNDETMPFPDNPTVA